MAVLALSKAFLALPTRMPSTSAARVAIMPAPTLMVSLDSSFRWWLGRRLRMNMPSSAPPKMHDEATRKMRTEPMVGAQRSQTLSPVECVR